MRILHIVGSIENEAAGPSVSVPRLAEAQARKGAEVSIATVGDPSKPDLARTTASHLVYAQTAANIPVLSALKLSRTMHAMLKEMPSSFDVVHSHGLWLAPNVYPAAAAKNGVLWVVSPRGMLGAAALRYSATKKRVFWALAQKPALRHVGLVHATSYEEAREASAMGIAAPVVVVPNGVDLPATVGNNGSSKRTILSLGRVHPKKGLDRLVNAWAQVGHRFPEWRVRIVGPDEGGHAAELRAQIKRLGVSRISIEGPLFGADKEAAYRDAGVFVLPTLHENFAMTVAEALAAETPVIATKGAPWSGLETHVCGRWIEHGSEALAAALIDMLALGDDKRAEMGSRGRKWMTTQFSWDGVGAALLDHYRTHIRD